MRGMARVIHPFPVAVVATTSTVLLIAVSPRPLAAGFVARAALVVLLTQIPVGALNDLMDQGSDAVFQRDKPIPSGEISPDAALLMTLGSLALLIPAALSFGVASLVIITVATLGGLAYDLGLKHSSFSVVGYVVGFLGLMTWIFHVAGSLDMRILWAYPVASILVTAAHLAQSYPDIESDRAAGAGGLAVTLGVARTRRVIFSLYAALAVPLGFLCLVRAPVALLPIAVSALLALAASRCSATSRAARVALFHRIAPALALLALAAVPALPR
ncbi:MAG TPA: UbiA family prenyltransferase [Chloroflexota bacterium]|nr:UbiA family prenyltransferase [Chloroflexota bacterium]